MYGPILAALTFGLFPISQVTTPELLTVAQMEVAVPSDPITIEEHLSASGVLVVDLHTGQRLYAFDPSVKRPMASLTKLMTALIIVENHELTEEVRIPQGAADTIGNKVYLPEGHHFTVGDLLSALLISSANDAAKSLAIYHSGSISAFVTEMNERAQELHLQDTSFADPIGYDDVAQYSTPQDIGWLTMFAQRYEPIAKRMRRRGMHIVSSEGDEIVLAHTHALMHAEAGVTGGKTGTTAAAGQCLISIIEEEDRSYLIVLMNSLQRYKDTSAILDVLKGNALVNTHAFATPSR